MRRAEVLTGGARVTYAVLAAVLAGFGGALVAAVAWPVLTTEQTCANDVTELCGVALGLAFYVVGFWLVLGWLAYVFRLGWLFWVMVVVGQLVAAQMAVEWISVWPLGIVLLVVPLAAWLSTPGQLVPSRAGDEGEVAGLPRPRLWWVVAVCTVLVVQLGVWIIRLLA